ncbi:MAG: Stp1/IreP family PP2C-type Ser/Thr phosphatase [Clostridia bacterium]|nr:Stp1/IreP family PP2C-type Ser/Thr phosphatase [Clostridia bacterium]
MRFYGITDVGKERNKNEDIILIPKNSDDVQLFVLADGMGGAAAGEIASNLAVSACKEFFENNIERAQNDPYEICEVMRESILAANEKVLEMSINNEKYYGMGTTLIALYVCKNKIYIGHIGDSRVYRIRKNIIRQLTKDHSFVQELVNSGTITKQEAKNHPRKNVLTKVIGYEENIQPDIITKGFLKDDVILMCSDGLTNMVEEKDIYEIIAKNTSDVCKMTKTLVDEANQAGGLDNISVITISND